MRQYKYKNSGIDYKPKLTTKPCSYCKKPFVGKFTKCFVCYERLKEAKAGDPCYVCGMPLNMKKGPYGEFMTCSAWFSHGEGSHVSQTPIHKGNALIARKQNYLGGGYFTPLPSIHEEES